MANESILIIEDNELNLILVKTLLRFKNFDIYTAKSAEEALESLAHFHPQIIIMDIQLPGIDGLTLTRKLKADPTYKDIIIIALTAYGMEDDKEKALAAGCDDYIAKPIDINTFAETIATNLKKTIA